MKPKREYFNGFLKKINCYDTSEMLIIGDELEKDILGGMNNNIDTCWFNRRGEKVQVIKVDYEIKDLLELKRNIVKYGGINMEDVVFVTHNKGKIASAKSN